MLVLSFFSAGASAYTTRAVGGCNPITFASTPNMVLHTSEMSGFDFISTLQYLDVVTDIYDQFNAIGGTSARIGTVSLSTDAFTMGTWFGDPTPTIHVGFTSNASAAPGTTTWNVDAATCDILEAHIQLKNPSVYGWQYTEPSDEPWYMAGLTAPDGDRYMRIAVVHELIHAFGLAHSPNSYAMMNYGDRAWANRPYADKIKPLPDDIEGLRNLYPAAGSHTEIAVLNSWFDPNDLSSASYPAAKQKFLCAPSGGNAWTTMFDSYCGDLQTVEFCPGETVYTRVAVANYGTDAVDVDMNLWFSLDDVLDTAVDRVAAQTRSFSLGAQSSSQQGRVYKVPALAYGTEYHVIVRAQASEQTAGGSSEDWIPLRGTIRTKPVADCVTPRPWLR